MTKREPFVKGCGKPTTTGHGEYLVCGADDGCGGIHTCLSCTPKAYAAYEARVKEASARIAELERVLKIATDELEHQGRRWEMLAGGIDYDADPEDRNPEDANAHLGGLSYRDLEHTLAEIKSVLGEK